MPPRTRRQPKAESSPTPPPGGTMEVKLTGSPDEIRGHLGIEPGEEGGNGNSEGISALSEALKDPKNSVIIRRTAPRTLEDGTRINNEVWRENCPMTLQDITDELEQNHGGRKYRVAVINSETGDLVTAERVEIDADPIAKEASAFAAQNAQLEAELAPTTSQMTEESLKQQARLTAQQIEYEQLSQTLEDLKARRANGKVAASAQVSSATDAKIAELEKQLEATKTNARIETIQRESQAKIDALTAQVKALTEQMQRPQGADQVTLLLQQMQEDRKESNRRFEAMMNTMRDQKMDAVLGELRSIKNAPKGEGSSLKENIETLRDVAEMLGIDLPGGKRGDDDEPKEWYESLIEQIPRIFDMIDEKKKEGKEVSKEELVAQINAAADKAAADHVAKLKARAQQQQHQLPAPQQQPPMQQPPSGAGTPLTLVPPAEAPAQPAPAPQPGPTMSVEDEIKLRVGQVMTVISRESMIRPREFAWPLAVWGGLPEDLLERCAQAADPVAMISAFDGIVNQEGLDQFKAKIKAEPKLEAWMARGLAELKEWSERAKLDPNFDPLTEEEEIEEETPSV